jgi:DNA processing protein
LLEHRFDLVVEARVESEDAERATLVALLRTRPGALGWSDLVAAVIEAGSAQSVWQNVHAPSLFDEDDAIGDAARDITAWRAAGLGFHTFHDQSYPAQLREIHQLPPILFSWGTIVSDDQGVSVVGSRRASADGQRWAKEMAEALVDAGRTVVSGLAAGIDTAAHEAALKAGGRTVAIIGTGINRCYPGENRDLQDRIGTEGLVLSQFWPDAAPSKTSFPMRNATMSGYGRATIVVEAGETSGARIQARLAVEHGRPVILRATVLANEWARALRDRPGVRIASTVEEALAIALEVGQSLDDLLSDVAVG